MLGTVTRDASQIYPPVAVTAIPPFTDTRARPLADSKSGSNSQSSSSTTMSTFGRSRSSGRTRSQVSTSRTTTSEQHLSSQPDSSIDVIRIRISGLRNKLTHQSHGATLFSQIVQLPANAPIERIGVVLKEKHPSTCVLKWNSKQATADSL
jgi:hypothetical protein